MTAITGPRGRVPWQGVIVALIMAGMILAVGLILLGLTGDFLVDWLWFSAVGYSHVFWTTVAAQAAVFLVTFVVTAAVLWANASLALRLAQSPWMHGPTDFEWKEVGVLTLADVLEFMRLRLPWPLVIGVGAGLIAALVAWGEMSNWGLVLRFLYQVPYGLSDPLYSKDVGFYLF